MSNSESKVLSLCVTRLTQGFDEFMNVTLDEATEVRCSDKERKELGRLLLKGDNIVRCAC